MNDTSIAFPVVVLLLSFLALALAVYRMRRLNRSRYGKWRRMTEGVSLSLLILLAVSVAAATTFNALAVRHNRELYPAPGKFYIVDGYRMHIDCTGQGSPTLILDAGLGNDSLIWGKVRPELSKTTRVCSYDRAGFGWSDPRPGPQDAGRIAAQLHSLLQQAGITGSIVLMGHSIAGMYIRAYASRYPHHVAGLIFVDASTPLQQDRGSAALSALSAQRSKFHIYLATAFYLLGIPRIMGRCSQPLPGFGDRAGKMLAEDFCHPSFTAVNQELASFRESGNETIHTGPYGDLPILIFSQDPALPLPPQVPHKLAAEQAALWNEMQEDLKRLSTHSRRIIAIGSGHHIPMDRADLLNREVPVFIQQIRNHAPQATDNGSTKTE